MRTTLDIDDDVLAAARELARRQRRSIGKVISELARDSLTGQPSTSEVAEGEAFYGFRPLPRRTNKVVTNQLIDRLRDDDAY